MPPRPSSLLLGSIRSSSTSAARPTNIPFSLRTMSTGTPSGTAQAQATADANAPSFSSIGIKRTNIESAPGVNLSEQQKVIVGSVLDVRHIILAGYILLKDVLLTPCNSFSRATQRSSTSACGTRTPPSQTTSPSQPATPSTRHNSTASRHCSSPSNCSRTTSSRRATPSRWT